MDYMKNWESYESIKKRLLKDPVVRKHYDELGPQYELIKLIIKQRNENGLTQAALAKKIGTKQSAISRFESGTYNPTLSFLYKVADALGAKLKVTVS